MDTSTLSDTDLIANSFERLQREARGTTDIEEWFNIHLKMFEPSSLGEILKVTDVRFHEKHAPSNTLVSDNDARRVIEIFYTEDPDNALGVTVELLIKTKADPVHPFLQKIGAQKENDTFTTVRENWTIPVKASDWSFIVSQIASYYLDGKLWLPNWNQESGSIISKVNFLNEHLPRHFPGTSLENLKSLSEIGVLDDASPAAVRELLYATRATTSSSVSMPTNLDL